MAISTSGIDIMSCSSATVARPDSDPTITTPATRPSGSPVSERGQVRGLEAPEPFERRPSPRSAWRDGQQRSRGRRAVDAPAAQRHASRQRRRARQRKARSSARRPAAACRRGETNVRPLMTDERRRRGSQRRESAAARGVAAAGQRQRARPEQRHPASARRRAPPPTPSRRASGRRLRTLTTRAGPKCSS